jgi:hypothetical protein
LFLSRGATGVGIDHSIEQPTSLYAKGAGALAASRADFSHFLSTFFSKLWLAQDVRRGCKPLRRLRFG